VDRRTRRTAVRVNERTMRLRHAGLAIAVLTAVALGYVLDRAGASPGHRDVPASSGDRIARSGAMPGFPGQASLRGDALPAPGTPLRRALANLQARATAGDVAAATRLYADLAICARLDGMERAFAGIADEVLSANAGTADAGGLDADRIQLDDVESRRRNIAKFRALCEGIDRNTLDLQVPALRRAAQLGDANARACYLARGPAYDAAAMVRHPEWLQGYRSGAAMLIDAGIAAGDWRVVDLLRNAFEPGANGMLAGVVGTDPLMHYRYLRLYRLGAEPYRVVQLDRQLAAAAARLSPSQRADADFWADAARQQQFDAGNSTESTVPGWDPCAIPYDPW
jgi:hypothetical protein